LKIHRLLVDQISKALKEIFTSSRHADRVIEFYMKQNRKWGSRDRRFFAESVYDLVRAWRLHWALAGFSDQDYRNGELMSPGQIGRVWATYWLLKTQETLPWPEFENLSLHQITERRQRITDEGILLSFPDELLATLKKECPEDWLSLAKSLNEPADVYLRANSLKTSVKELALELAREEISVETISEAPLALHLVERKNVFASPVFRQGWFEVQDLGSQKIAPFCQVEPGFKVVDACAGAGGKTLHLACLMQNKGKIISLDVVERKLEELKIRTRRNGVDIVEARWIENNKVIKRLEKMADRVLLDVPCSGLGVLRRNPDKKWKITQPELDRLRELQWQILSQYSAMTKVGGKLIYATCSVLPSENSQPVKRFLAENASQWIFEEEILLRPDQPLTNHLTDGFYAARLVRKS
jgi:16S rRNA (cytosine967-C5)-methyltransferase